MHSGFVATQRFQSKRRNRVYPVNSRGAVTRPAMLSDTLPASSKLPAPCFNARALRSIAKTNLVSFAPAGAAFQFPLVHKTAHTNVHHETQRQEHEQH